LIGHWWLLTAADGQRPIKTLKNWQKEGFQILDMGLYLLFKSETFAVSIFHFL
jgi:hypothetical protein